MATIIFIMMYPAPNDLLRWRELQLELAKAQHPRQPLSALKLWPIPGHLAEKALQWVRYVRSPRKQTNS